jgi:hypothetical protein
LLTEKYKFNKGEKFFCYGCNAEYYFDKYHNFYHLEEKNKVISKMKTERFEKARDFFLKKILNCEAVFNDRKKLVFFINRNDGLKLFEYDEYIAFFFVHAKIRTAFMRNFHFTEMQITKFIFDVVQNLYNIEIEEIEYFW